MKGLVIGLAALAFFNGGCGEVLTKENVDNRERLTCEIVDLDEYGFEGEADEYVCASLTDYTDFVILVGDFAVGDEVTAIMNENGVEVDEVIGNGMHIIYNE